MVRHRQVITAVVIVLGLTASLIPAASADPPPLAGAEVPIAATQNRLTTAVRPNPDNQAVTSPAAAPALTTTPVSCGDACSANGYDVVSTQPASVRVTSDGGFHWGDAGIGAGVFAVLLVIGFAATRTVTKGRNRRLAIAAN